MSIRRAALGAFLALSLLLAGCTTSEDAPADPAPETGDAAPDSRTGDSDAAPRPSGGASGDVGHMPHIHDYWNDRERVTIFDDTVQPSTEDAVFGTLVSIWLEQSVGKVGGALVQLPEGAIVYEGTGLLEITASWEDPLVTSLEVHYQAAGSRDFVGPTRLESGTTVGVDVTPEMTDLPHSGTSRWAFGFLPADTPGSLLGAFHLKVDIVRMHDIMEFPGHPDLFGGHHEKILLDADGRSEQVSYAKRVPNLVLTGEFGEHEITPADLVPMQTRGIMVEVDVKKAEASVGEVADIRLYYRTADSWEYAAAEKVSGSMEEKRFMFHLPVEPSDVDSPYADESAWRFLVEAATSFAGESTCGGCVDTEIEFHILVTALDHAPGEHHEKEHEGEGSVRA